MSPAIVPPVPRLPGCPDGGHCHHLCGDRPCFRVLFCGPLTDVYPGDRWPDQVRADAMPHGAAWTRAHVTAATSGGWTPPAEPGEIPGQLPLFDAAELERPADREWR